MERRRLLAASAGALTASAAGCLGSDPEPGRLDLTVQNDGDGPVDVDVVVSGDDGTTYAEESDRVDAGVARAFEASVGETGRHEVTVTGTDWEGRLAWNAGTCRLYDAQIAVDGETVEVAGGCVDAR